MFHQGRGGNAASRRKATFQTSYTICGNEI